MNDRSWSQHEPHSPELNGRLTRVAPALTAPGQEKPPSTAAKQSASGTRVWRLARRALVLSILVLLGWWVVVPFVFPLTSQAVVNARTVQVRAPIDGLSVDLTRDVGDEVAAGQPLLQVTNGRVDTSHLAEVKRRLSNLEAEAARLRRELKAGNSSKPILCATAQRYRKAVLASLKIQVAEAEARCKGAQVECDASEKRRQRLRKLTRERVSASVEMDDVQDAWSRARKILEKEQASLARLQAEWESAKSGLFLQNEASYSQRRVDELEQRLAGLAASLAENADKLAAARVQLREERERIERLTRVGVTSPVHGVVWRRPGNLGQVVKKDEVVYEIADRNSLFVEALLHQRYLASSVTPGARATINLTCGKVLTGRVRAVRTLGETNAEQTWAINLSSRDMKRVRVLIALDTGDGDSSLIGRHGRVLITDEQPGLMHRSVAWLFCRLGG
jgi:multidrug resistance efflux pump